MGNKFNNTSLKDEVSYYEHASAQLAACLGPRGRRWSPKETICHVRGYVWGCDRHGYRWHSSLASKEWKAYESSGHLTRPWESDAADGSKKSTPLHVNQRDKWLLQ